MRALKALRPVVLIVSVAVGGAIGIYGTDIALERFAASSIADARPGAGNATGTLVGVSESGLRSFRETVEAVGTTVASQSVEIVALAPGRVERIAFSGGDQVAAGDVLLELDSRVEKAAVKEAEANLAEARAAFQRAQDLYERKVNSEAALEQARAAFLRAEAALSRTREDLDNRTIRAPFAGIVGLKQVETGARIDSNTVITTLDDISEVEVEFSVPELFFARVAIGQPVLVRSDAFANRVFRGKVTAIDSRISRSARAFKVRVTVPNQDRALRTGMFVGIELVLEERTSPAVPEEAIISEGNATYIFAMEDGKARRVEVTLGLREGGFVEVLRGLEGSPRVITSGAEDLEDGAAVRTGGDVS